MLFAPCMGEAFGAAACCPGHVPVEGCEGEGWSGANSVQMRV